MWIGPYTKYELFHCFKYFIWNFWKPCLAMPNYTTRAHQNQSSLKMSLRWSLRRYSPPLTYCRPIDLLLFRISYFNIVETIESLQYSTLFSASYCAHFTFILQWLFSRDLILFTNALRTCTIRLNCWVYSLLLCTCKCEHPFWQVRRKNEIHRKRDEKVNQIQAFPIYI